MRSLIFYQSYQDQEISYRVLKWMEWIIKLYKMKKQKNIPVLHEVLQRQNQYETHLYKLQQIQAERKKSLARKSFFEKTVMIEHIRNQKHSNFIQRLSKESMRITQENLRIADKLTRATVSVSSRSKRSSLSASLSYSVKRNKEKEITKENSRMFHKLNNSCPFVNTNKINEDYEKIKKIGNRLRKYDDSCELKTKKFIKTSTMSASNGIRMSAPSTAYSPQKKSSKYRPKIASFYSKEDIIKNKIQHRGIPSAKILLNTLQARQPQSQQKYYDFFNTQVTPNPQHPHA